MSLFAQFLVGIGLWVLFSFSIFGVWMLLRAHYIRKSKREAITPSKDDIIFATVQEFRSGFSTTR